MLMTGSGDINGQGRSFLQKRGCLVIIRVWLSLDLGATIAFAKSLIRAINNNIYKE